VSSHSLGEFRSELSLQILVQQLRAMAISNILDISA